MLKALLPKLMSGEVRVREGIIQLPIKTYITNEKYGLPIILGIVAILIEVGILLKKERAVFCWDAEQKMLK